MSEEDYRELAELARKMKNDVLMQEPCPIYDGDEEDWDDFWYNNDK